MSKLYKFKKLRPIEVLLVVFVCLFILAVVPLAFRRSQSDTFRIDCGKNLSVIGKAMLIYANDYDGELPRSGGKSSIGAVQIPNWAATDRLRAFGIADDGSGGDVSISSFFYLLIKYGGLTPKSFVCKGDSGTTEFIPADEGAGHIELVDLWDFGPEPYKHCSYSYHVPFGLYRLTTSSDPGMAVAADRNPWIPSPASDPKDPTGFDPDGDTEAVKAGNAITHQEDGQNVFFLDGHMRFEKRSFCGINDDNIYTMWDGGDIRSGTIGGLPTVLSAPQNKLDSLLLQDMPLIQRPPPRRPRP